IPLSDFVSFWSAGRWVLQGRDPYTLYWLYPLWLTFPLIPLGALEYLPAAVIWLTLTEVALVSSVLGLIHLSGVAFRPRATALVMIGTILFAPTLAVFFYQQISIAILFLLVLAALSWRRDHPIVAGLFMALALGKPHLTLLVVLFWLTVAILRGEWRILGGFVAGLGAELISAELVLPMWATRWFESFQTIITPVLAKFVLTLNFHLAIVFWAGAMLALAVLLAVGSLLLDERPPYLRGWTLAMVATMLFSPRPIVYDLVFAIAPLVLIATRRTWRTEIAVVLVIVLSWTIGGIVSSIGFLIYPWVIGLAVLLSWVTINWQALRQGVVSVRSLFAHHPRTWRPVYRQALLRLLILGGMISTGLYLSWCFQTRLIGSLILLGLLSAALFVNLAQILGIWFLYLHIAEPNWQLPMPGLSVDVYVTSYHEPLQLIARALRAAQAMRYPHRTYLLDDGREPECRALAERLGVEYITRLDNRDAKAGNINHALTKTAGELIAIFDIDHAPCPEFLDRVLGYFLDPQVGFVQVMLAHCNQEESFVARAAAEQTFDAFGPTFMGMHGCESATAFGSNCTFRRATLQDIGGYQAGLAEDLHTSIHVHAQGWKSVYVPEVLAYGLVPGDLIGFFKQQFKWARGVFEVLFSDFPYLAWALTPAQQLSYLVRMTYYLAGPAVALNQIFLILYLIFGSPVARLDMSGFLLHWLPFMAFSLLIRQVAIACWQPDPASRGFHLRGMLLVFGAWPVYTLALICALLRIRIPFIATPKQRVRGNYVGLIIPQLIAAALLLFSIGWRMMQGLAGSDWIMIVFALMNVGMYGGILYATWESRRVNFSQVQSVCESEIA
ncbi:MAG: glycosyltransferase, partial [Anaerolineae bacterium]